jgi:hypothetical protein
MYIKYIVSLIGTGGLTYLSKGENHRETEPMYIKHSVSLIRFFFARVLSL